MATLTITNPAADDQAGITAGAYAITWTLSGATQDQFSVGLYRASDGANLSQSGVINSSAGTYTVTGLPTGVRVYVTVGVHDTTGGTTYATRYFTTNYVKTLTITDPAANNPGSFPYSSYDLKWTFSASNGDVQAQYRVQVVRHSDGYVIVDSGLVTSGAGDYYIANGFPSGVAVDIYLTSIDTSGLSTGALRTLTAGYTGPPTPTFTVYQHDSQVTLTITNPNPAGGQPLATSDVVQRRKLGETAWTTLTRLVITGTASYYSDFTARSGVTYEYIVGAVTDSGIYSPSAVQQVTITPFLGIWTFLVSDPAGTLHNFQYQSGARSESLQVETATTQYIGRQYPVAEYGSGEVRAVAVGAEIPFGSDHDGALDILRLYARGRGLLCYRDNRGRKVFGSISGLTFSDNPGMTVASFTVTAAYYVEGVS